MKFEIGNVVKCKNIGNINRKWRNTTCTIIDIKKNIHNGDDMLLLQNIDMAPSGVPFCSVKNASTYLELYKEGPFEQFEDWDDEDD